jgi:hypothetical protein
LINQNTSNSINFTPLNTGNPQNESNVKLNEDQYEVYVNDHFVGHKTLKSQGENLTDIDDFLRNQGIETFSATLNGDHYNIQTNENSNEIIAALDVYFNNR